MPDSQHAARDLFARVGSMLGDRLAERRLDPDGLFRLIVIGLIDADVSAIEAIAAELGVAGRVHVEAADPSHLDNWERLRHDLVRLQDAQPEVLQVWPAPEPGYRRPPVSIDLAAFGASTAADLHARYGGFVALRVGALRYPATASTRPERWVDDRPRRTVDPGEVTVALDGPLSVRSGVTAHHRAVFTYPRDEDVPVPGPARATAHIIDVDTGEIIGGFAGSHDLVGVHRVSRPAGRSVRLRLTVGTASFRPELGYALPPGRWHLIVPIGVRDGTLLVSPPLAFTITG